MPKLKAPGPLPLRYDPNDLTISDADMNTVVPSILYRGDQYHVDKQRKWFELIKVAIEDYLTRPEVHKPGRPIKIKG